MSSLGKLEVLGIRSFGPNDPQGIKFTSPVTLIVGQNGSGKTTLIECLRYATTGEVPSFSAAYTKYSSFAHDLNVSHLDQCKSQVKLQFFDVTQGAIVAIRSMNSVRKTVGGQKKIDCKSLDGIIRKMDDRTGEISTIPTKCADMNREMSSLLGVTDAVLNSVIFCHQEDSNWPLSEPKALKCRFDDIFNSTKYMKVLDAMRHNQKELTRQVGEFKRDLAHLQSFKDHAKSCREQIEATETSMRQYEGEVERLKAEIAPLETRLNEIGRHRKETDRLGSRIVSLKSEKATEEKNLNELRANISDFYPGTIEELKQEIEHFESDQDRIQEELNARKRDLDQLDKQASALNRQKGELLTKKGKLEAEIHSNKEKTEKRDKQISDFATKFGVSNFPEGPFSDVKVSDFQSNMHKKIRRTNEEMDHERIDYDKQIREAKSESERASNAVAANEQAITLKETAFSRTEKEINETRNFLSDMDSRQTRLEKLDKQIDKLETDLESAERQVDEDLLKADIARLQTDRNSTDAQLRALQEELKTANRENSLCLELDMLQKEKASKDDILQKLLDKHRETRQELFSDVRVADLRDKVDDEVVRRTKDLQDDVKKLNEKKLAQKSKEQERDMRNADLKSKEKELREAEDKIFKVTDGDNVEDELEKIRESLEKLQFEKGTADGSESVYKNYIKKLENRACCPLCERNFEEKKDATNLSEKLKREIKSLPAKASSLRQKIEEQQKKQTDLLQLQPVIDLAKNLKTKEIPALNKRIEGLTAEVRGLKKEIDELNGVVDLQTDDEQRIKALQADCGQIDSLNWELQEIERRVNTQKEKLGSNLHIRTVETIVEEMKTSQDDLDDISSALTSKQDMLSSHRDNIQQLRQKVNDLTKEKLSITDAMQQRIAYQEKLSTLTKQRDQYQEELKELRRQTQSLKRKLDDLRSKETKCESEKESGLRKFREQLKELENCVRIITDLNESIRRFQSSGKANQFDDCVRKIEAIESELADFSRQCAALTEENGEQERALNQSKTKLRDLNDSLKVKEKEKRLQELSSNIGKLTTDFERLGGLSAADGDYDKLLNEHASKTKRVHTIEGQQKALEQVLVEKRELMNSSGYKDADDNYFKKSIQIATTDAAANDLQKYYKALDKAIIEYHSAKMEEINEKLRELWQKIYKHNDIDYIAIRSEGTESTEKRRAYNYRVVMHSGGAELDMRGRCSAGQKVLACILIRVSLAEVFSASCGVLALDEPTTNLDEANIRGLAEALVEIIQEKSQQKNFQLVLITHDENFLRMLLQGYGADWSDSHYRIKKDDNGYSRIEEKKNSELLD